jgi:hypothetical protein
MLGMVFLPSLPPKSAGIDFAAPRAALLAVLIRLQERPTGDKRTAAAPVPRPLPAATAGNVPSVAQNISA